MPYSYEILIIALMLALNAVFAAFEMALASISQARLLVLVNQKRRGASSALYLKERIGASLAAMQVGATLQRDCGRHGRRQFSRYLRPVSTAYAEDFS